MTLKLLIRSQKHLLVKFLILKKRFFWICWMIVALVKSNNNHLWLCFITEADEVHRMYTARNKASKVLNYLIHFAACILHHKRSPVL